MLFEIAWEVCNQVGGIYTVIQSKVPSVLSRWEYENYILLGPYFEKQVGVLFEPTTDFSDTTGKVVLKMRELGFDIHYGRWLIDGKPKVVLFNPYSAYNHIDSIKYSLWEQYSIATPAGDEMIDQVITFSYMVKEFFREYDQQKCNDCEVIAHFHEWMAGLPIADIRHEQLDIKTVFTTHATLLGRYLAMIDANFYANLPHYNWIMEAQHFNIMTQVNIERAAAHNATVFTTISEPTALECRYLLGREPDKILPNGLNIKRFEALHEFQNIHKAVKERIHEFVMGHFFPSYTFDLDKTLYFFTSGRFEYRNKGFDMALDALAKLNWKLKEQNIDVNIVMFFITRQPYNSIIPDVLNSRFLTEELRRTCDEMVDQLRNRLFYSVMSDPQSKLPDLNSLIDEHLRLRLRRTKQTWKSEKLPLVVTHNMINDSKDALLTHLRSVGLFNRPEDKVKIIYHPDFLTQTNPLFRMDYTQFVRGCHLGIFPSYYEPWGYTPLECLASGLPSITSDLSGFGNYVMKNIPHYEENGMYVINRRTNTFQESAEELANKLVEFCKLNRRDRINIRNNAEATSIHFDWNELGKYYQEAYDMALESEE